MQGGQRTGAAPPARGAPSLAWQWRPWFACRHLLGKWTRKLLFSSSDHEELKMLRLQKNWHLICCVLWAVISVLATIPITATENPNPLSSIIEESSQGNLLKGVDNLSGADWIRGKQSKKVPSFWTTSCLLKPKAIIADIIRNLKGSDIINCIFFKYRRQFFSLFLKNPVKKRKRTPVRFELTIWLLQGWHLNHWATKLLYKEVLKIVGNLLK